MSAYGDESDAGETVFEHITALVENVQDYVPGGLHPVHLGDTLCDARYKILRKLGYGDYSTVWLAQDNSERNTFVALKIARADSDHAKEVQIHDLLRAKADQHPGSASILMLRDHFKISGPNGIHDCLVYNALGPSIAHLQDDYRCLNTVTYLTLPSVRKIVYQVLLGLDYMHSVGVVHGDLYTANVLFAIESLSGRPLEVLCQSYDEISVDVKRIRGPQQPGDPRNLTPNRPLDRIISLDGNVKLSDLGNSFFENDPPSKLETPAVMRSPEMILGGNVTTAQDCWAFGCFIYNILTNCYPFDLGFMRGNDARDDTHLIQLSAFLGLLPNSIEDRWPRYHSYFDEQGQLAKFDVDDDFDIEDAVSDEEWDNVAGDGNPSTSSYMSKEDGVQTVQEPSSTGSLRYLGKPQDLLKLTLYPSILKISERQTPLHHESPQSLAEFHALHPPLRERLLGQKHPDIEPEEFGAILDLLQGLFAYDPKQRFSTKDLLQHDWIQDYCTPGNETGDHPVHKTPDLLTKRKRTE